MQIHCMRNTADIVAITVVINFGYTYSIKIMHVFTFFAVR